MKQVFLGAEDILFTHLLWAFSHFAFLHIPSCRRVRYVEALNSLPTGRGGIIPLPFIGERLGPTHVVRIKQNN